MTIEVGSRKFQDIAALETLVVHAATEYEINGYVEDFDGFELTDPEYDELLKSLRKLNPNSVAFRGTSPSVVKSSGDVVVHDPPMTSISKADGNDKQVIYDKWIADCFSKSGKQVDIAQSFKRDGVAVRINYVKGKLKNAGLRPRDGVNGSDITRHIFNVQGVPKELNLPLTLSLNGEIECWLDDFKQVNAERDEAGEELYKNPRNYTAGCLGRDDPKETKNARLRIAYYSITGFDEWDDYYNTEIERAKWANSPQGLNLQKDGNGYFVQVRPHRFEDLAKMESMSKTLPYYTDGVVLKVNDLDYQESLGHVGDDSVKEPRGALAWKYAEETAEAIVTSIEWNASRTGRVVPTAIFAVPFVLADTENNRATCNNFGWMESQGLGPGAKVRCKKGGKIIPNIMAVLTPVNDVGEPKCCPSCQGSLKLNVSSSGNKDLICKNDNCPAKHVKGWIFYLQTMGCKGVGSSAVERILNSGKVKNLADLYTLQMQDLLNNGFSERQALLALAAIFKVKPHKDDGKFLEAIEKAKSSKITVPAWQFVAALGISGTGRSTGKALIGKFKCFDKIKSASVEELTSVDGVGETTAQMIHKWFRTNTFVDRLLTYVDLELPKSGKLVDLNFVLTGEFDLGKKYWEAKIQDLGGNVQSGVGSKTNYLVQQSGKSDGSPSSKEIKAAKLGVPCISVDQLQKML